MIDGFIITGGSNDIGAGVYIGGEGIAPTIANCTIKENKSGENDGAGIYIESGNPIITNCRISNNENTGYVHGGGIYVKTGNALIEKCTISDNRSNQGAGIFIDAEANPKIVNCTIRANYGHYYNSKGGGIYNKSTLEPNVVSCTFVDNHTSEWNDIQAETHINLINTYFEDGINVDTIYYDHCASGYWTLSRTLSYIKIRGVTHDVYRDMENNRYIIGKAVSNDLTPSEDQLGNPRHPKPTIGAIEPVGAVRLDALHVELSPDKTSLVLEATSTDKVNFTVTVIADYDKELSRTLSNDEYTVSWTRNNQNTLGISFNQSDNKHPVLNLDKTLPTGTYDINITAKVSSGDISSEATKTITVVKNAPNVYLYNLVSFDYNTGSRSSASRSDYTVEWSCDSQVDEIKLHVYNTSNYDYGAVLEIDDDLTPGIYEVIVTAKVSSGGVSSDSVSQTIKVIKKKLTGVVASLRSDKTAITLNLSEEGQINFYTTVSLDYNSGQRETANSSNCNVTWTMNPTVSGITLQTSGTNAYLKMPSNLAYGTYTITVTATASSGGITADPVSQTVTINKKGVTGIEASLTASKTATTLDTNQTDSIKFTEGVTFTYNIGDPKQALRNDDNDYYSVAWTLSPDVSGITLSDNTSEYDENGVTLNIGSNLAPGTYHVTVTAIVSRGSVKSAPVSQTVTITKNPPKLTSINASLSSSSESLTLDRASSGSLTFTPTITAYYDDYSSSNIASGYAIEWSMTPAVSGITLENGTLTIAPTTQAGSYTQKVTADVSYSDFSYKAESTVYITVNDNQLTLEQYLTYTGNDSEGVTSLSIPDYVENLDILASLTSLESLDLKNANKLTSVNLSGNTSIREVYLNNNSSITTLDLSGSSVRFVTARETNLTEINLENCEALEHLDCSSSGGIGNLRTLNLKGCSALKLLVCSGNKLLTLDVNADEHPALEDIECFGQSLAIEELNNDIDTSKPELNLYDLISGNDSDFDPDNVMASIDIETIDDFRNDLFPSEY